MSDPQNNGAQRITPEAKLGRSIHELIIHYLSTGGNSEFVLGLLSTLDDSLRAPALLNFQRQAQMQLEARSQTPKQPASDEPNPRLSA